MSIQFRCRQCQQLIQVPDQAAGQQARCPNCAAVSEVPGGLAFLVGAFTPIPSAPPDPLPPETAPPPQWSALKPGGDPQAGPQVPYPQPTSSNPYASPRAYEDAAATYSGDGAVRPTVISLDEVFHDTWAIFQANMGMVIGAVVIVNGVNMAAGFLADLLQQIGENRNDHNLILASLTLRLVFLGVNLLLTVGQSLLLLDVARGRPVSLVRLLEGGRAMLPVLGGSILISIMVLLGTLALIVPGVILALMFGQFYLLIVDRRMGVFESLSMSKQITDGNKATLFLIYLAASLLMVAGVAAACVGVLFTGPFVALLSVVAYLKMSGQPHYKPVREAVAGGQASTFWGGGLRCASSARRSS